MDRIRYLARIGNLLYMEMLLRLKSKIPASGAFHTLIFSLYPVFFMGPLFWSNRNSHIGKGLTDVDGAIHFAAILQRMVLPWSENFFTDYLTGSSIWRIQNLSQLVPIGFLWINTRLWSAPVSVSLFIILGWIISGFVVYYLAKEFEFNEISAILAGLTVQVLPIMRTNAANYVNYVWVGVPLICILLMFKLRKNFSISLGAKTASFIFLTALFDVYWLYFVFVAAVIIFISSYKDILIWVRGRTYFVKAFLVGLPLVVYGLCTVAWSWLSVANTKGSTSRAISVTELNTIRMSASGITDYVSRPWANIIGGTQTFQRPVGYVGIVLIAFALGGLLSWVKSDRPIFLIVLCAMYFFLTLPPEVRIFGHMLPLPSGLFRFVSPGLQYPTRAGAVLEPLLVLLAVFGVTQLLQVFELTKLARQLLVGAILVFGVIDLNPLGDRVYSEEFDKYGEIRQELNGSSEGAVLALPMDKLTRTWHEQWMMETPFANSMYSPVLGQRIDEQLSGGPSAFAAFMHASGFGYLYIQATDTIPLLGFRLIEPRFQRIATVSSYGYERGPILMNLYRVKAQNGDNTCSPCKGDIKISVLSTFPTEDGNSYWASEETAEIKLKKSGPLNLWNGNDLGEWVTYDLYSLNAQRIQISDSLGTRVIELTPNQGLRMSSLTTMMAPVQLKPLDKCARPQQMFTNSQDPRTLCFNIFNIHEGKQ